VGSDYLFGDGTRKRSVDHFRPQPRLAQRLDLTYQDATGAKGWMGDANLLSHPEMSDVTIGFHKHAPTAPAPSEERTRKSRLPERSAKKRPTISSCKTLLGTWVCRCISYSIIASAGNSGRVWTAQRVKTRLANLTDRYGNSWSI